MATTIAAAMSMRARCSRPSGCLCASGYGLCFGLPPPEVAKIPVPEVYVATAVWSQLPLFESADDAQNGEVRPLESYWSSL